MGVWAKYDRRGRGERGRERYKERAGEREVCVSEKEGGKYEPNTTEEKREGGRENLISCCMSQRKLISGNLVTKYMVV